MIRYVSSEQMSLQAIAHYRITGTLGQGGMGQVYRAVDTELNFEVAIKVIQVGRMQAASPARARSADACLAESP